MNIEITKLSSRGQVVIPKGVRDRLGFEEGTPIELVEGRKGVFLRKVELPKFNIDSYEDTLFLANKQVQKEIAEDVREYAKTGGVDYQQYRKRRLRK